MGDVIRWREGDKTRGKEEELKEQEGVRMMRLGGELGVVEVGS